MNVNKLNTYIRGAEGQRPENLEKNRMNVNKLNTYIRPDSRVNYEVSNRLEFANDVGYSETMERDAVTKAGLKFIHPRKQTNV